MGVFQANNIEELKDFTEYSEQLAVLKRSVPEESNNFFQKLMSVPLSAGGEVRKEFALEDIQSILEDKISVEIKTNFFISYGF